MLTYDVTLGEVGPSNARPYAANLGHQLTLAIGAIADAISVWAWRREYEIAERRYWREVSQ